MENYLLPPASSIVCLEQNGEPVPNSSKYMFSTTSLLLLLEGGSSNRLPLAVLNSTALSRSLEQNY